MPHKRAAVVSSLPVSLIFGSRQQKQYRRFQLQTEGSLPCRKFGALPTAEEYDAFRTWCQANDSGYFSDTPLADIVSSAYLDVQRDDAPVSVGRLCGHALHPAQSSDDAKTVIDRCPTCIVEMHTLYVSILMRALENAGGMVEQRWEASPEENPILEAVHAGKIELIHAISNLEELAMIEKQWDQQHPDITTELKYDVKTAGEALRMYWASIKHASADSSPPLSSSSSSPSQKAKRKVKFDDDTRFERGRDPRYFWRRSPRYEAGGKYSLPSACDESDSDSEDAAEKEVEGLQARMPLYLEHTGSPSNDACVGQNSEEDSDSQEDQDSDEEEEEDEPISDDGDSDWEDVDSSEGESDEEDSFVVSEEITEETAFIEFGY
ncbi:hypothetical protein CC80DRAFT_551244 [Byssothecium circinans]|uniref:Uncharacterized protein n=1 Tax=Byssothecium circinans TaxID=147558 RepID=A0A6A5TPG8_9PLEO|nr:hypothetical protein CC80DRAFT_551244 [Byssothecium circinans]